MLGRMYTPDQKATIAVASEQFETTNREQKERLIATLAASPRGFKSFQFRLTFVPLARMLSLSGPAFTVPLLPAWSTTVSSPESLETDGRQRLIPPFANLRAVTDAPGAAIDRSKMPASSRTGKVAAIHTIEPTALITQPRASSLSTNTRNPHIKMLSAAPLPRRTLKAVAAPARRSHEIDRRTQQTTAWAIVVLHAIEAARTR